MGFLMDAVNAVMPKRTKRQTQFQRLVPFDFGLPNNYLTKWSLSRTKPEYQRQFNIAENDFMKNLSQTGGYRFGTAPMLYDRLENQYKRGLREEAENYEQAAATNMANYWLDLYNEYYRDPNAPFMRPVKANALKKKALKTFGLDKPAPKVNYNLGDYNVLSSLY